MLPGVARGSFFDDEAKRRTTNAIREIEAVTAVEVVVTVRPRASHYLGATLAVAAFTALTAFLVMWFSPVVYDVATIPLDVGLTFLVTAAFAHYTNFVKRRLTPSGVREAAVSRGAERAFAELGIAKTRDRTGMLVFVSLLEGAVTLRPDEGIDLASCGARLSEAADRMKAAVAARDIDAFIVALESIAEPLAALLPRKADDTNELSDEVA
jgi:putative membrane protein